MKQKEPMCIIREKKTIKPPDIWVGQQESEITEVNILAVIAK